MMITKQIRLAGLLLWALAGPMTGNPADLPAGSRGHLIFYTNEVDPQVPWSMHVVKISRAWPDFQFCTTSGKGDILGMDIVSEQVKTLPSELGRPLVAINGDFYDKSKEYTGRPRDVQIRRGELISSPSGHTSFWIDPAGQPHMTNVTSRLRVVLADGSSNPMGLNEAREAEAVVLYTATVGSSTRTSGGVEYVLERAAADRPWLPLRAGQAYETRVRAVKNGGDAPVDRQTLVLSVGPRANAKLLGLAPGATLKLLTETSPDLAGVKVAVGGGPALVHDRKVLEWNGMVHVRHPRTALGWNKDSIFLVVVDGRQIDISVGMTFPELAQYMLKLGCDEAMNFDGGGSATLWYFGIVKNSPSEGQERPAANALVLVRKKTD
jgi:Phosphodiester glycosidase